MKFLVGLILGILVFTPSALAGQTETQTVLTCSDGDVTVYTPNLIATGRSTLSASWGNDPGLAYHPTIVISQNQKPIATILTSGQRQYASVSGLPTTGPLTLNISAPDEGNTCSSATITIPREKGYSGLALMKGDGGGFFSLAKNTWTGIWSGDTSEPSGLWMIGSCTPLLNKPIILSYTTSGVAGNAAKTLKIDACKLAPRGLPTTKISLPQAVLKISDGYLDVTPIFRIGGTQTYRVKATWGSSAKQASWRATWTPARTIWQGTDDFVNICINDTYNLYSKGGQLYCTISGYIKQILLKAVSK